MMDEAVGNLTWEIETSQTVLERDSGLNRVGFVMEWENGTVVPVLVEQGRLSAHRCDTASQAKEIIHLHVAEFCCRDGSKDHLNVIR